MTDINPPSNDSGTVAQNPRTSDDDTERQAMVDLTYELADSQIPERLARFASHEHPWVRQAVAGNPMTPQSVIAALADDPAPVVRRSAAVTSTDRAVLGRLARDADPVTARASRASLRRLPVR